MFSPKIFEYLTNEQLSALVDSARTALLSGSQITSWSAGGTSVSKTLIGISPDKILFFASREVARRKAAETFPADELPEISASVSIPVRGVNVPFKLF